MGEIKRTVCPSVLRLLLLLVGAASGTAHAAVITEVADSSAGYSGFSAPSVNNAGAVAFNATTSGTAKIFTGVAGGPVTPVLNPAAAGLTGLVDAPSINNIGQIAFVATEQGLPSLLQPFQSAFRFDPGNPVPIRTYDGVNGGNYVTTVTTSQTPGTVFFGLKSKILVMAGAGSGSGGTPDTLIPVGPSHGVGRISASASGDWAINVAPTFIDQYHKVVRDGVTVADSSTITFTDPPFTGALDAFGDTDTTSDGTVVFSANFAAVYYGLFSLKNGTVTRLARDAKAIPAINDNGTIAALLTPTFQPANKSIVFGQGKVDQTLISVGDPLAQSTVTDLAFIHDGLSENGNLTFYAALADGRTGIFVTNVPEPATCAALITLLAPAALLRRRR